MAPIYSYTGLMQGCRDAWVTGVEADSSNYYENDDMVPMHMP